MNLAKRSLCIINELLIKELFYGEEGNGLPYLW